MNWLQIGIGILNIVIFAGALCIGGSVCAYLYRRKVQQLPENQRLALEQFAQLAVQSVEQIHKKMLSNDAKKSVALAALADLYKAHPGLKEPAREIMEMALESAVYWLKHSKDG